MSFGGKGEHRDHRSGGKSIRRKGQIFANTFQGKLAEFSIYNELSSKGISMDEPDLESYDLGRWDNYDFCINDKKISVKSTKFYGNLLLLEKKDWDENGEYIPNKDSGFSRYDYFILVRIKGNIEAIMRENKCLYSDVVRKDILEESITSKKWSYDIPGFITHKDLITVINDKYIIPQEAELNNTKMDADNYYVQSGDMRDIHELFDMLKAKEIEEDNHETYQWDNK